MITTPKPENNPLILEVELAHELTLATAVQRHSLTRCNINILEQLVDHFAWNPNSSFILVDEKHTFLPEEHIKEFRKPFVLTNYAAALFNKYEGNSWLKEVLTSYQVPFYGTHWQ